MRTTTRLRPSVGLLIAAAAVTALVGGGASTASNTMAATDTVGYASTTVSGATVNSLAYTLSTDGQTITSVALVLDTDTTTSSVAIGFNDGATASCGTGTYDTTATETAYTCGSLSQSTSGLTKTAVVVN